MNFTSKVLEWNCKNPPWMTDPLHSSHNRIHGGLTWKFESAVCFRKQYCTLSWEPNLSCQRRVSCSRAHTKMLDSQLRCTERAALIIITCCTCWVVPAETASLSISWDSVGTRQPWNVWATCYFAYFFAMFLAIYARKRKMAHYFQMGKNAMSFSSAFKKRLCPWGALQTFYSTQHTWFASIQKTLDVWKLTRRKKFLNQHWR